MMNASSPHICILGGGFGGLYTALRLSQLFGKNGQNPQITLIDKEDRFLFSPFLYELMTGELQTWEIAPPFEELLADTSVRFQQGWVTKIDLEHQQIHLNDQKQLDYTKLVIALGGTTPLNLVTGVKDYAIPFRTLTDAYRLGEKLRFLEQSDSEKIRVAIIGGGYSGVELACKLADRLGERGRIRIIERAERILATSPEFNREIASKALESRRVYLDLETEVEEITANTLSLRYKGQVDIIPVDVVLWTVGNDVSPLIRELPFPHNPKGQIKVNSCLQVLDYPDIYALGDVADCQDADKQHVPATAQAALQQADYCAWNVWATLTHRPLLPFRYQALGEMMTLGVENATLSGLGLKLDGIPAVIARRLVYLYRFPTLKHQLTVGLNWMTQPLIHWLS